MEEEELKQIYSLYTDLWKLFREHHGAQTEAAGQSGRDRKTVWNGQPQPGTGNNYPD